MSFVAAELLVNYRVGSIQFNTSIYLGPVQVVEFEKCKALMIIMVRPNFQMKLFTNLPGNSLCYHAIIIDKVALHMIELSSQL